MIWRRSYALTSAWNPTNSITHGSKKFRPRSAPTASPTQAKAVRGMRFIYVEDADSSSNSDLSGSDAERKLRNVFVAATSDRPTKL